MKKNDKSLKSDDQIARIRALFEAADQAPPPPRGFRKLLHDLAERISRPQKKIIMKRVRDAAPPDKNAA
jgi:hypothetical protein